MVGKGNRSLCPIPQIDRSPQKHGTQNRLYLKTGLLDRQICRSGHWPLQCKRSEIVFVMCYLLWGLTGDIPRQFEADVFDVVHVSRKINRTSLTLFISGLFMLCSLHLSQLPTCIVFIWQMNNTSVFWWVKPTQWMLEHSSYNFFHNRRNALGFHGHALQSLSVLNLAGFTGVRWQSSSTYYLGNWCLL